MQCCSCKHAQLEPIELEAGLLAAGCPSCKGALLPLMNYRFWAEHEHHVKDESTDLVEEPDGAKQCPKCQRMMTKYRIGAHTNNRIELCSHCDEVWLDAGEWGLVKHLHLEDKLSSIFTEAWQRNIRRQKEADSLRKHYEELIGKEEFERLLTFKTWLDQHPKRSELLVYLTARTTP